MENRVKYTLCYPLEKLSTDILEEWCRVVCKTFSPNSMSARNLTNGKFRSYHEKKWFANLDKEVREQHISINLSDDQNMFSVIGDNGRTESAIFTILIQRNRDLKLVDELMEKYMLKEGIVAYKCASEDYFWQNADNLLYYTSKNRSLDGVKITTRKNGLKDKIVDVEYNPGHTHMKTGIWFGSCYQMWFGTVYYKYIPKNKILGFSECFEKKEMENGVLRVTLYEDMWDFDNPHNREIQWKFRRSVGMDEVAHAVEAIKHTQMNPEIEILDVKENGMAQKVIHYYLDMEGKIVHKDEAVKVKVYAFLPTGEFLYCEEKNLVDSKSGVGNDTIDDSKI